MHKSPQLSFDLFVVGGGPGGLTLAERAAKLGLRVGIADKSLVAYKGEGVGAVIPSLSFAEGPRKLIHFVSELGTLKEDLSSVGFGSASEDPRSDWPTLIQGLTAFAAKNRHLLHQKLVNLGIRVFAGHAAVVTPNTVELTLADNQKAIVEAKYIALATGLSHTVTHLPIPPEVMIQPDELFLLKKSPGKTLIIGVDYQALELAGFLQGIGCQVSVIYQNSAFKSLDQTFVQKLLAFLATYSEINLIEAEFSRFERVNGHNVAIWKSEAGTELSDVFDTVIAMGKHYLDASSLGIDKVGVQVTLEGRIKVDDHFETSVKGIYAIGEVATEGAIYATVAAKQAAILATGLAKNQWQTFESHKVPKFLFTPLEYAFVGYNEAEAKAAAGAENADSIDTYYANFTPLEWNFNDRRKKNKCYLEVIHDIPNDKVLGIHYLGPNAAEVIQGFAPIVASGLGLSAIQDTVGIHPTTAEEITNIKLNKRNNDPNDQKEEGC